MFLLFTELFVGLICYLIPGKQIALPAGHILLGMDGVKMNSSSRN